MIIYTSVYHTVQGAVVVAEWKSTTSASCNWWQPPPVQVECLHQLREGKHHKHKVQRCKVQRSDHKVQRSGPGSALVSTICNYSHHHHWPCRYDQHSMMQQSVQLAGEPTTHPTNLALTQVALIAPFAYVVRLWGWCVTCEVKVWAEVLGGYVWHTTFLGKSFTLKPAHFSNYTETSSLQR